MEYSRTTIKAKISTIYLLDEMYQGKAKTDFTSQVLDKAVGEAFDALSQDDKNIILLSVQDKLEGRNRG